MAEIKDKLRDSVTKMFRESQANELEGLKHRSEYLSKREQFMTSNDGERMVSALQILKDVSQVQTSCVDKINEEVKILKENLYNYIRTELGYDTRSTKEIEFYELEQIINEALKVLKMMKKICNDKNIRSGIPANNHTNYEKLFDDLIMLDARFAVFAPIRSINRSTSQHEIKKLPAGILFDIEKTKKRLRKNEKADYVALYQVVEQENNERVEKFDEMAKPVKKAVVNASTKMANVAEKLSDDIYKYFESQIEIYKDKNGKISDEKMSDIVMLIRANKNKLEELTNNKFVIRRAKWEGDLVADLIEKLQLLDPRIEFVDLSVGVNSEN